MQTISAISLNMEYERHLHRVEQMIRDCTPDVLLLQECPKCSMAAIAARHGYAFYFSPMTEYRSDALGGAHEFGGVAFLSRAPVDFIQKHYYAGDESSPVFLDKGVVDIPCRVLIVGQLRIDASRYVIGNTHFTWTPDGKPSEEQWRDLAALKQYLARYPEMTLCGDLNAPRGGPIFSKLQNGYTDNIPETIRSTLDPEFHYRRDEIQLVVDHLLTTAAYEVQEVRLLSGISDHLAVCFRLGLADSSCHSS